MQNLATSENLLEKILVFQNWEVSKLNAKRHLKYLPIAECLISWVLPLSCAKCKGLSDEISNLSVWLF